MALYGACTRALTFQNASQDKDRLLSRSLSHTPLARMRPPAHHLSHNVSLNPSGTLAASEGMFGTGLVTGQGSGRRGGLAMQGASEAGAAGAAGAAGEVGRGGGGGA